MNRSSLALEPSVLAERLMAGAVAVIPTDTVAGLAALPAFAEQIWSLKRRPADKPLILMGASESSLFQHVDPRCREESSTLAKLHWPGALTLVLPAFGSIVQQLNPGGDTLGLRIPASPLACKLLRLTGPLATSSANPAGHEPASSLDEAASMFPTLPKLGPAPWPLQSGRASTVVRWLGPGSWQVLRQGAVML